MKYSAKGILNLVSLCFRSGVSGLVSFTSLYLIYDILKPLLDMHLEAIRGDYFLALLSELFTNSDSVGPLMIVIIASSITATAAVIGGVISKALYDAAIQDVKAHMPGRE